MNFVEPQTHGLKVYEQRFEKEQLRDPSWGEGFSKSPLLPHQTLVPPQEAPSFS